MFAMVDGSVRDIPTEGTGRLVSCWCVAVLLAAYHYKPIPPYLGPNTVILPQIRCSQYGDPVFPPNTVITLSSFPNTVPKTAIHRIWHFPRLSFHHFDFRDPFPLLHLRVRFSRHFSNTVLYT